jgi:hypothetical protein
VHVDGNDYSIPRQDMLERELAAELRLRESTL